jgi:hypothetical protein
VATFEAACRRSKAVINRPVADLDRLAASDRQLYATYYQRVGAEVQAPTGDAWDRWRRIADATLFPLYEDRIRFGALSLDGVGVQSYGECSLVLRDEMIAQRTTVFEDNSAVFVRDKGPKLRPGHRATWGERSLLCVAKLAPEIDDTTKPGDFASVLLHQGATPEEDRFVEVHVWGPLTARTCERAILSQPGKRPSQALRNALRVRLAAVGIELRIR